MQLCGFGPIAAAARAGNLISRYQPERVLLVGIAGTFDAIRYPVGSAHRFTQTCCDGIGVGHWRLIYKLLHNWDGINLRVLMPSLRLVTHCR